MLMCAFVSASCAFLSTKIVVLLGFLDINQAKIFTTAAQVFICGYENVLFIIELFVLFYDFSAHCTNVLMCRKSHCRPDVENKKQYQENAEKPSESILHFSFLLLHIYVNFSKKESSSELSFCYRLFSAIRAHAVTESAPLFASFIA